MKGVGGTNGQGVFGRLGRGIVRSRVTIITALVFFACWELFIRLLDIPLYILPPPSLILYELVRNISLILKYTLVTAFESFTGFILSALVGVPLSMLIAFSLFLRRTIYPGTVALQLVPKIALAPLFVTWFGFGIEPKIIIVFLLCFFPILLNGILGFTSLSPELGYFSLSTGADPVTVFMKVRLPSALPQVFVGLKWAAVNATVGATIGEWIGGDAGLGYYIQIATGDLRMDLAFAIILVLAALGLLLFYLVLLAERKTVPWHVSQRKEGNAARF
jgi:NitT/TauT family transport system permease protein